MNTTIASLLDPEKLAALMDVATEPAEPAATEPTYPAPKVVQRLTRAGAVDLSNYSDAQLGQMVRNALLTTTRPPEPKRPELTPDQDRKVAALMETLSWQRPRAVAFVRQLTATPDHDCAYYERQPGSPCQYCDDGLDGK